MSVESMQAAELAKQHAIRMAIIANCGISEALYEEFLAAAVCFRKISEGAASRQIFEYQTEFLRKLGKLENDAEMYRGLENDAEMYRGLKDSGGKS